ncbi:proton-coupled zinc antiporter SLC30A1-like [Oppia nitens]|uniref:proton-coupled zinc antiporter SLC30A1-like n=1 Tax=Oppia nitens TaxID=1686743 RepID=UPI0023DA6A45|nr:proton-coupled zinc antiporter SLC30A1-like [Oppia nitens]
MNLRYLYALIALEGVVMIGELVASQLTHSLIILTDGYHTLYNILSIVLLIISYKMSNEKTVKNTFGWARIEVLGMLVNMTFLVALTFSLVVEGIQQLVHSSHEISGPTNYYLLFAFGFISFISNLLYFNIVSDTISSKNKQRAISLSLKPQENIVFNNILSLNIDSPAVNNTQSHSNDVSDTLLAQQPEKETLQSITTKHENSEQNVFYLMFRDLMGSVLVILCAVFVLHTDGWMAYLWDPIFGIIAALVFCLSLYPEIKNTMYILLETVPENIDVEQLKNDILKEFPNIVNVHDLHIWGLTSSQIIGSCHIILPKQSSKEFKQFSQLMDKFFKKQGIRLVTVQPEFHELNELNITSLSSLTCRLTCCLTDKDKINDNDHNCLPIDNIHNKV